MSRKLFVIISSCLLLFLCFSCVKKDAQKQSPLKNRLLLSQAQFKYEKGSDGKSGPIPGPARLEILTSESGKWSSEVIEDTDSNVFHKAVSAEAIGFPGRILTIGGNGAFLKLWKKEGGAWKADVLWHTEFGGKQNRLRDMEIADVTADGKPDIVIATHDQGVIAVLQGSGFTWTVQELCRSSQTFVHEIEIGDLNGNGVPEIYSTPSAPNKMDGTPQPGKIVAFEFQNNKFIQSLVEEFPERHVKEILVADSESGKGKVLYAALEAETAKGNQEMGESERIVDPVKIKRYEFKDGSYQGTIVAEFQDRQCRFLNSGDVRHNGQLDLVASGFKSGLWLLEPPKDISPESSWTVISINSKSSGYEHATLLADFDGNGRTDIFVAADDQKEVDRYSWQGDNFSRTSISTIKENTITFGLTMGKL